MLAHLFPKEALQGFDAQLKLVSGQGLDEFMRGSLLMGVVLMLASLGLLIGFGMGDLYITTIPVALLPAPLLANYFLHLYKSGQRKLGIEKLVPDILLQASIFPRGSSMERVIDYIAEAGYGELSKEFGRAALEIRKGASVIEALKSMKERNRSRVLGRAVDLLILGYNSGADMGSTFKEAADDLLESNSILRERSSSMLVEKYTLLFAGGFIVPVVLGLIVGMVSGFDFAALSEFEIGMGTAQREAVLGAALLANTIYIAEYALLASAFVANQEGQLRKTILYAAVLLPLSQLAYALAQVI